MRPRPRCIHSSGATRSSVVKTWSLYIENAQLSTCGAGKAVIARSSLPVATEDPQSDGGHMAVREVTYG